jgi:hypothetical protein
MTDEIKQTPQETVSFAADRAAQVVAAAVDEAKKMVDRATEVASEIVQKDHAQETKITRIVSDALKDVFDVNEKTQRFIDVSKIPLICKSIVDIHENIKDIKQALKETDGDHEIRIRVMEKNQWKIAGAIIVGSPIVTIGISLVIYLITKH